MTINWEFGAVFDHAAQVGTFASTLEELRADMLHKAMALVQGDGTYRGQAPEAFLAAFQHMSQQSENVIQTVQHYGRTIESTGQNTLLRDQAEASRFNI